MSRLLLRGGRIFDGTGAPPAAGDVVVERGRILAVGTGLDGDEVVELAGHTLLPGLFDCHVHVLTSTLDIMRRLDTPFSYVLYQAAGNLRRTLEAGVTTVRDASGADLGVKRAVDDGLIAGPRMQVALTALSQTGGHADAWLACGADLATGLRNPAVPGNLVDGPEQARRRVRELVRAGADVIKICTSGGILSARDDPRHAHFQPEELDALVAEAAAAGLAVMAHAQAAEGIKRAVRAGVRSIEHGIFLDDEALGLMVEHGTWLVPTLVAPTAVLRAAAAGTPLPEAMLVKAREVAEAHRDSFARAVAAGVRIAMGTDSGVAPHGRNLDELALMRDGGMRPEQALAAASSAAAELMGLSHELGSVEPGKRADLVIVAGDALDLDALPGAIRAVYKDGALVAGGVSPAAVR